MTDEATTDFPEGWKPQAGQTIKGKVAEVALNDMGYGPYPIVTLDTAAGTLNVHAFHTVLKTELARRRPKIGDEISITYVGKTPDSNGRRGYHSYRVSGGQQAALNWDAFLPETEQALSGEPDVPIDTADLPEPDPVPVTVPAADDESVPF